MPEDRVPVTDDELTIVESAIITAVTAAGVHVPADGDSLWARCARGRDGWGEITA